MDEEIGGIINEAEEGGAKKDEGFTRFVLVTRTLLLLLLFGSGMPGRGVGVDEAGRGRAGTCGVGAGDGTTLGAKEDGGTAVDE